MKKDRIEPGSRWRHYKGGTYEVMTVALDVDRQKEVVVYHDEEGKVYVRSVASWTARTMSDDARFKRVREGK